MTDVTTADFTALHYGLVRDWMNHGPSEVFIEVQNLTLDELHTLVMLYVGRDAVLSSNWSV